MTGPYTKLTGIDASGPICYPDDIMDAGTLSVIDFKDSYTWPSEIVTATLSTTAEYKQFDARLVSADFIGTPVKTDYAFTVSASSIVFDGTKGRNLILPDCYKLDTGLKHWAACFWLQMSPVTPNGFNNNIVGFIADNGTFNWHITPIGNSSNVVTNLDFNVRRNGTGMSVADYASVSVPNNIFNSTLHQLVFEYDESPDGTKFTQRVYLDGALIATRPNVTATDAFFSSSLAGYAKMGNPAGYSGGTFVGNFRRAWFEDLSLSSRAVIDMVKLDYDLNKTRLLAA